MDGQAPWTEIGVTGPLDAAGRAALGAGLAAASGGVLLRIASDGVPPGALADGAAMAEVAALAERIEALPGPVVAVLSGAVRGAALELALACTARVAAEDARLCLPDVALGLPPGAGASQRLPALIGGAEALRLLLTGAEVSAAEALALGLVDGVGGADAARPPWPARRGLRDGRGYMAAVAAARSGQRSDQRGVRAAIVDCVEAALVLPRAQGLGFERVAHEDLRAGGVAQGLIHAERARAVAMGDSAPVARLGLWGQGAAAAGLALEALVAGLEVHLAHADRAAVVATLADVAEGQEAEVQAGRLSVAERDAAWARLLPQVGEAGLAGADLVLLTEAGPVDGLCLGFGAPGAGLSLSRLDRLAEVAVAGAAPVQAARAVGFARAMGWVPVRAGPGGPMGLRLARALGDAVARLGALGADRVALARALAAQGIAGGEAGDTPPDALALRCLGALANEGARLIAEGVAPSALHVDAAAVAAGIMAPSGGGPMHQADRRGLLVLRRDLRLWAADDAALWSPAPLLDDLIAAGRGFT